MAPPPPPPPPPPPGNPPPPPPRPVDNVDIDDERHRREEAARRAKRKAAREKPKSDSKLEKDRKRREHAQRVLQAQQKGKGNKPPPPSSSSDKKKKDKSRSSKSKDDAAADAGGSSTFQSLFAQRVSGFLVDLRFRNAPPRPPVGPCFVGLGLDGVLHGSWTRYRPANAVENGHAWKLHPETDLGVPLAPSAMDLEGCYVDPTKPTKKTKTAAGTAADGDKSTSGGAGHVTDEETNGKGGAAEDDEDPAGPPPLHPHDESLLQWTGSLGDTAAEELQVRRDRARAAARLRGEGQSPTSAPNDASSSSALTSPSERNALRRAKAGIDSQSRILDENLQFFMKKTTYLTNDQYRSVHRFTSLAQVQKKAAEDVDRQLSETKKRVADRRSVEKGFDIVNGPGMKTIRHPNPSKRGLTSVWDVPLLPDVHGWGRTYTHVVLDKMPRASTADNSASSTPASPVKSHKNKNNKDATTPTHLERAFVADVGRADGQSKRLRCKVLVPLDSDNDESANNDADAGDGGGADNNNRNKEAYEPVQEYDLDVLPLLQEDEPNVNFVLLLDPPSSNNTNKNQGGGVCWYHPVQSRVALSTGRPVVGTTNATSANASGTKRKRITTLPRGYRVSRRVMNDDDVADLERAGAEVDLDLAEKHGMVDGAGSMEEEDDYGGGAGGRRQKEEVEAVA